MVQFFSAFPSKCHIELRIYSAWRWGSIEPIWSNLGCRNGFDGRRFGRHPMDPSRSHPPQRLGLAGAHRHRRSPTCVTSTLSGSFTLPRNGAPQIYGSEATMRSNSRRRQKEKSYFNGGKLVTARPACSHDFSHRSFFREIKRILEPTSMTMRPRRSLSALMSIHTWGLVIFFDADFVAEVARPALCRT